MFQIEKKVLENKQRELLMELDENIARNSRPISLLVAGLLAFCGMIGFCIPMQSFTNDDFGFFYFLLIIIWIPKVLLFPYRVVNQPGNTLGNREPLAMMKVLQNIPVDKKQIFIVRMYYVWKYVWKWSALTTGLQCLFSVCGYHEIGWKNLVVPLAATFVLPMALGAMEIALSFRQAEKR